MDDASTRPRTVVVTGGGSGGHITPILSVARELKRLEPDIRIVYIGQKGDGLDDVVAADKNIDEMFTVPAGKFRRYNGEGLRQLFDWPTMKFNIRDGFAMLAGLWQSFRLLRRIKPGIIFTRGSYVSVPVCLAGAVLHIPYVTHDSDALPSLTNRIIARWAYLHAVALPEELYPYPIDKTKTVGVPVSQDYKLVTDELMHKYRKQLKLDGFDQMLLVTGGGLGAQRLNEAVVANAEAMLRTFPRLVIVHLTGRLHEDTVKADYLKALSPGTQRRVMVKGFVTDMYRYTGAASVVIARGGATNLAELEVQAKACIIVPNPQLTGGHQLKNTAALAKAGAIIEMTEDQLQQELRLAAIVSELLGNREKTAGLSRQLRSFAKPHAALQLASLLIEKITVLPPSPPEESTEAPADTERPGTPEESEEPRVPDASEAPETAEKSEAVAAADPDSPKPTKDQETPEKP